MNNNNAITTQVEIWQAQTYWPIKGWAAPLSGAPHYSCVLFSSGVADSFPSDLLPPVGWKWSEEWAVDTTSLYGTPDTEGWFYSASFDRIHEQMRNATASGLASATCTVRKRRWVRAITCISSELAKKIRERADRIVQIRVNIEKSLKDKEASLKSVSEYEAHRASVFAQSLHMATQSTLNTLGILKDISNKMKVVKQYLSDRALMERDHAIRLEKLARKYLPLDAGTPAALSKLEEELDQALDRKPNEKGKSTGNPCTAAADLFFNKIVAATNAQAESLDDYSRSLVPMLSEMDAIQGEILDILKDARLRFRKNTDICRLSEAAIQAYQTAMQQAYASVSAAALQEVEHVTEELTCLRGGLPYHPGFYERILSNQTGAIVPMVNAAHAAAPRTPTASASKDPSRKQTVRLASTNNLKAPPVEVAPVVHVREDCWLSVQRYKVSVRDAQEALSVLISEYMDLELQQQIVTNRSYTLLVRLSKQYAEEEVALYDTLQAIYSNSMKSLSRRMKGLGLPYPTMLSPFAKLNPSSDAESCQEYVDFMGAKGVFAFTSLYRAPLPVSPGIVLAGNLLTVPAVDIRFFNDNNSYSANKSISSRLDWKEVYALATSDGYLHVMFDRICDIPDRSFYIKHCTIKELGADAAPLYHAAFEISTAKQYEGHGSSSATSITSPGKRKAGTKGNLLQGLVFRNRDGTTLSDWLRSFHELSYAALHAAEDVEAAGLEAMQASLPILRGETAQIDLTGEEGEAEGNPSDTSSDYGEKEEEDEADEVEDKVHNGGFSDDESDYPRSAVTTPFTTPAAQKAEEEVEDYDAPLASETDTPQRAEREQSEVEDRREDREDRAIAKPEEKVITPQPIRNIKKLSAHFSTSKYEKKEAGSWIKKGGADSSVPTARIVGVLPVGEIKPPQLIPVADRSLPLATRHSQMIAQYENGLQFEKQKSTLKMKESKGQRLRDFGIEDDEDAAAEHGEEHAEGGDKLAELPSTPTPKARSLGVKRLSRIFDANSTASLHNAIAESEAAAASGGSSSVAAGPALSSISSDSTGKE